MCVMAATEYRAQFDAVGTFSSGGGLRADGFQVDVPGPDVTEQEIGDLFIASLNLLMVGSVELRNFSVFAEPHKGTRGGPADRPAAETGPGRVGRLAYLRVARGAAQGNAGWPGRPAGG